MPLFKLEKLPAPNLGRYSTRSVPIDTVMMHRIKLGATPRDVLTAFAGGKGYNVPDAAAATGEKMPYTFLVAPDGGITQHVPLDLKTPHGWKWNNRAVGIGVMGDFRVASPTDAQWRGAATLAAILAHTEDIVRIVGHTDVEGSTSDPSKECPGKLFSLDAFRRTVSAVMILNGDKDWWAKTRM